MQKAGIHMHNLGILESDIIRENNGVGGVNQPTQPEMLSGLYVSKAGSRRFPRGFSYDPDRQHHWEWGAVLDGEMVFSAGNKSWRVPAGTGYMLRPGLAMQAEAIDAPFLTWLEISGDNATTALEGILEGKDLHLGKYSHDQLYSAVKIPMLLQEKPLGYNYLANGYLWRFLAHLLFANASGGLPLSIEIRKATEYIGQSDFSELLSMHELAAISNLSVETFRKRFERETGMAPTQYIIRQRMKRAKVLMEDEAHSLADIALRVGIENPYYFSRLFHKQEGVSPSAYRKRFFPEQG
jgi:AraC-like DNA-binding protein